MRINIKNLYSKSSKDNKEDIEPQTPPLSNKLKPKEDEWKITERRSLRAAEIESTEKFPFHNMDLKRLKIWIDVLMM